MTISILKAAATCDSLPREGREGFRELFYPLAVVFPKFKTREVVRALAAKPLPATSQPDAPLPWEGVLIAIPPLLYFFVLHLYLVISGDNIPSP